MTQIMTRAIVLLIYTIGSANVFAFDSGSTGADGPFNPTADITVALPPDGILNYTSMDIPNGVTVTYTPNTANTPVTILVQNNATIGGVIDLTGGTGATFGFNAGGPGGFRGGQGGLPGFSGGNGLGPGGGSGGVELTPGATTRCGGAGGGYGRAGGRVGSSCRPLVPVGPAYGSLSLIPLIGGSGGGGGTGTAGTNGTAIAGSGGGGGGAILIAASGTITVTGTITVRGGRGQDGLGNSGNVLLERGSGGGGSGGAIRLVATTLAGSGTLDARGGIRGDTVNTLEDGGTGGAGRVRLEAENFVFNGTISPDIGISSSAAPQSLFAANLPAISITSINGQAIPTNPSEDMLFPSSLPDPVTVEFAGVGVPVGNTLELRIVQARGGLTTVTSTPLAGSTANSTATASVSLPQGRSVLTASVAFTVASANQMDYSNYAMGQPVEKIKVGINGQGQSVTTFITLDGDEFTWPSNTVAMQ